VSRAYRTADDTGYGSVLWPVSVALLVVLIPTACVLWFLNEAVRNERLAARQKLFAAYRLQLPLVRERLDAYWRRQAAALDAAAGKLPAPVAFAACVRAGLADAVVCYDPAGRPDYPAPTVASEVAAAPDVAWSAAEELEHARNDPRAAAAAYGHIAQHAADPSVSARAWQAQARCLVKLGQHAAAIRVLSETLAQPRYARAVDAEGRLIAADAALRVLELLGDRRQPDDQQTAQRLAGWLADYERPLPAAQRRFLIHELQRLTSGAYSNPLLPAEELAAAYVQSNPAPAEAALRPTGLAEVWHFASPRHRVVGILRSPTIAARSREAIEADRQPADVQIGLVAPSAEPAADAVHVLPTGAALPGWRLTLALSAADSVSAGRVDVYVWIAVLVIVAMSVIGLLVAGILRRQARLTRMKNDLLATVSHELKTPLASIRLLVDTLLDNEPLAVDRARQYLALIAKENDRLSRLIDNFLSFSRMERGKQVFEFVEVTAAEIVDRAVEAAGERFQGPDCRLDVHQADDSAKLMADPDALVTALLNLLDNAYKYSAGRREIALRTYADNGRVCFAVTDRGIGLSARAAQRIFRPFYQVDRRLSRAAGGCGLGLSIVKSIAAAHGGTIAVESRPGQGSTFTLSIPVAPVSGGS
jgi:signal transduction histidine kinase